MMEASTTSKDGAAPERAKLPKVAETTTEAHDRSGAYHALRNQDLSLDDLLSGTFNSILEIEEQSLDNRLTHGLTITDIHTIAAIGLYESNPMNVVADRLGITLATLTTATKKLESRGLVKRERSDEDRRKVFVSLTPTGRKVYRAHKLFHEKMLVAALDGLSEDEQRVLGSALWHIKDFFDEQRAELK